MSTQEAKFKLFSRLQGLGFTYGEAQALRRIEMTLHRWAELECGDDHGRAIERDEVTGKPYMTFEMPYAVVPCGARGRYAVADKELGALKRLEAIVSARNERERSSDARRASYAGHVLAYHQTDPRGCALYLLKRSQVRQWTDEAIRQHSGEWPLKSAKAREEFLLSMNYSSGLAVCC